MISDPEWESIRALAEKVAQKTSGKRQDYFITGQVIKVDTTNRCVYMAEFGDQPIPIVSFEYDVKYYETQIQGGNTTVIPRMAKGKVAMPKIGDTILVARELGTRRLPRALGILQGTNWIVSDE